MATFDRKATKHDEEQMLIIARDMVSKNGYVTTEDIRCSRGNYTLSMAKKLFKKLIASGDMRSDGDGGFILLDEADKELARLEDTYNTMCANGMFNQYPCAEPDKELAHEDQIIEQKIIIEAIKEEDFDDGFFETREGRIVDDLDMDLKNETKQIKAVLQGED
jgi:hypothetical protein